MVCHPFAAPFSMKTIPEPRTKTLTVNEIYHSIQGESTWAGLPCVFVRLTFCDLRCNYCDTAYAFYAREKMREYNLATRCHAVLFSPIFGRIEPREIVEWMLADSRQSGTDLEARFQLQLHKSIWAPTQRGV